MLRPRGTALMLSVFAIALSACASAGGAAGPGPDTHNASYQHGYHVGQEARSHYRAGPGSTRQDLAWFCDETAYLDVQSMKGPLVLWSEGFNAGCRAPLDGVPAEGSHRDNCEHGREPEQNADGGQRRGCRLTPRHHVLHARH
jgi:hypothetical protein